MTRKAPFIRPLELFHALLRCYPVTATFHTRGLVTLVPSKTGCTREVYPGGGVQEAYRAGQYTTLDASSHHGRLLIRPWLLPAGLMLRKAVTTGLMGSQ